jgi:hypothetical protein
MTYDALHAPKALCTLEGAEGALKRQPALLCRGLAEWSRVPIRPGPSVHSRSR